MGADEARKTYKRGVERFKANDFEGAAEAFRKAYELKPSWKLHYNIGQAEAASRRYGLALDAFEAYLVEGGDNIDEERRQQVLQEIKDIKPLVGTVEVEAPDDCELHVDGTLRAAIPLQGILRVAVGRHDFAVICEGEPLLEEEIKIAGEVKTLISTSEDEEVPPEEVSDPGPEPQPAETDTPFFSGKTIAGVVIGSLGLVSAGVGAVFFVKGRKEFEAAEEEQDRAQYNKKKDAYKLDNTIGIAGLAAGGALVVTGVVLIVVGQKSKKKNGDESNASIAPTVGGVAVTF